MSDLRHLIGSEIRSLATQQRIRGRIVSEPAQKFFDPSGTGQPTYVCDVDIGAERILRDVPVKINGPKARFYAQVGFPVYLDRDGQGRYQVTAPADRVPSTGAVIEIDEDTDTELDGGIVGNTVVRQPFEWYAGDTPETLFDPAADGDVIVWLRAYDRAVGLPANMVVASDVDGAEILRLNAKSPSTNSAIATTNRPFYRKFDSGNPNNRSTADFDGTNDAMDFASNVVESTPGELSIFAVVNKDSAGSGIDAVLELANIRLLSRVGADAWGVDTGAGPQTSGATIGTGFTLIEAIMSAYNSIALYQDGALIATITAAAGGLALGSSGLGYAPSAAAGVHNGRIAEVLVIDRVVNSADRAAIEAYFARTMNVGFSRWNNGTDGFPKISVFDANGNPV